MPVADSRTIVLENSFNRGIRKGTSAFAYGRDDGEERRHKEPKHPTRAIRETYSSEVRFTEVTVNTVDSAHNARPILDDASGAESVNGASSERRK